MNVSSCAATEPERLRDSLARRPRRLADGERRAELLVGGSFVLAATALALLGHGLRPLSAGTAVIYVVAMAAASRTRFDFGAGFAMPTQLVFVSMLFAVPVSGVPLLTALGLAGGMLPGVLRGHVHPSRMLPALANSWFAVGPAVVLSVAHVRRPTVEVPILLVALGAELAGDFLANCALERARKGLTVRELIDEVLRVYLIDAALSPVGLLVALATMGRTWTIVLVAPLFGLLAVFSREREQRLRQLIELNDAYRGTAMLLGDVVDADDAYTGEHSKGVVRLAVDVARALNLDAAQARNVEFAALLHDVGKIAVPKEIINKPGKLDAAEWEIIKGHTIEGQRMLDQVGGFMREVGRIVRSSHESWDGRGYPDGLEGEQIPLEARVVSACDAFSAMTTTRPYRAALPVAQATAELRRCAGTQFDPRVVDCLVSLVERPLEAPPKPGVSGAGAALLAPVTA